MSGITHIRYLSGRLTAHNYHKKAIRTISSSCCCLTKNHKDDIPKMTAENFKFSKSQGHPSGNDFFQNTYKSPPSLPSQRKLYFINFMRVTVPIVVAYLLYLMFTSDYDLAHEEMLMNALPGYEEEMMKSEKYATRINELRNERDIAK